MTNQTPYTTADVARMLNRSTKTIRSWCGRGVFPGAQKWPDDKPRSEWLIPREAVESKRAERAGRQTVSRDRLNELMDAALARSA